MPLVDMPLAELQRYRGINPKPDNFDTFWTQALDELDTVPPDGRAEPAPFATDFARCEHFYFRGVRGATIYAKKISPLERPKGAILMFHGYSMNSGDWADKLAYAAAGWTVYAMDVRGQGGRSEDSGGHAGTTLRGHIVRGLDGAPENMLYRQVFLDTVQLVRAAEVEGHDEIVVSGASQGGGLALACASLSPSVKRVVSWYPFLCDYRRVWEMDLARDAYDEMQEYFRRFDPLHEREEQTWNKLGYIDVAHLSERIEAEVLMFTGLMDTVCPPSTQFAAYNRVRGTKQMVLYPDFRHEGYPGSSDRAFQFLTKG